LGDERFGLVIVPMQTIQLLPDGAARTTALRALRSVLAPGARLAVAIVEDVEPFGADDAQLIAPDMRDHGGTVYASRPTEVVVDDERIRLRRSREIVHPDGERSVTPDEIVLRVLTADELSVEAARAGLAVLDRRTLEPTADHAGTTVVILGA
ncbi:MAG: hypothetical protein AB7G37_19515, partial [Solirubrobacteraceae bacterium]